MRNGIVIKSYRGDNGIYRSAEFQNDLKQKYQPMIYSGVEAHHHNGVAGRGIRTTTTNACTMLLHAMINWPNTTTLDLWPFAMSHAVYIWNLLPHQSSGLSPTELFYGVKSDHSDLKAAKVWGCPTFVLNPRLQDGKKIPKWEPRSRRGVFVGFSQLHSSDVPLILNLQTGSISPQFHVVFDDSFSTVASVEKEQDPPDHWEELCLENTHRIPLEKEDHQYLPDDWLTPEELDLKQRALLRETTIRRVIQTPIATQPSTPTPTSVATQPSTPRTVTFATALTSTPTTVIPAIPPTNIAPPAATTATPTTATPSVASPKPIRRSTRSNFGIPAKNYDEMNYIEEVYLNHSSVDERHRGFQELQLCYLAELHTDHNNGISNIIDPRAYAAKAKFNDPDQPSYHQAMNGEHASEYVEAMKKEIKQLCRQNTWTVIPRVDIPLAKHSTTGKLEKHSVLKGTWAFKLKRLPDGKPLKFKSRFCCRGDMQKEGVDYFETYAPVVQWSTIRLLLTLTLANDWTTRQVDYTNAFAQADLNEQVYVEPPRGFLPKHKRGTDSVLHLNKSLYGLRQAPRTFYEKLRSGLVERGFKQSNIDQCLFMKKDVICVVYVDDTIFAGPDVKKLEAEIKGLGVPSDEVQHTFELRNEGEVGDFLGIRIKKTGPREFYLTQEGLTDKAILSCNMENCNSSETPAGTTALGRDLDGPRFNENWDYGSTVGMLMYLAGNSRPDIAFAVHQCARFTHSPRDSHGKAVKRIIRYLQGTKDKGLFFRPTKKLQMDCYVDADFAGTWGIENDQDPVSVKSRTGYVIMFMGCPLLWTSKMQTQIALSTMEAEYLALSASMRDLIPLREVVKEILTQVLIDNESQVSYRAHSRTFEDVKDTIPMSTVYEDNQACLKHAMMPKMSPRTKHIGVPYHFFRSKIIELEIEVVPIGTDNQLADQFTKGLLADKFTRDRARLMGW